MGASREPAEAAQERMRQAVEPPFRLDLEASWGAAWGAADETSPLRRVVVRRPGSEYEVIDPARWDPDVGALVDPDGMWYWTDERPPDITVLQAEHDGLVATLRAQGVEVDVLESLGPPFIKSTYMRDPFVMIPGGAIVGRMAVRMRRGEERRATQLLGGLGIPILGTITGTGTLEGGSFMKLAPGSAALGTSVRCNEEGARQLATLLALQGIELLVVPLPGYTVHLDVHFAMVDEAMALVDVVGLPYTFMDDLRRRGFELIEADHGERPWALNLLCLGPRRVLTAEGAPRTAQRLADHGVEVLTIPYGFIHQNGGGIHCSTNELLRDYEPGG
jgi:N-dimethylarginine dimethylaminohydrolase